jgi:hypothetical protein
MTFENEVRRVADGVAERVREAVTRELQAAFGGSKSSSEKGAASVSAGGVLPSIRRMDQARTLSSVLDVLAEGQASESARTAVFLVVDGEMRLWKRSGSGWEETETPPAGLTLPVAETRCVDGPGNGLAAPIRVGNRVVALVYSVDRLAANVLEADARETAARLELLTRHAGRTLEAITALRTAQLLAANPGAARAAKAPAVPVSAAHSRAGGAGGAGGGNEPTATEDVEAARRYARLVVSEIKLYHEPAVAAGVRDGDLASRLSGEIARARALYHERVPAQLPEAEDVFRAELVRTLAGGDASLFDEGS